VQIIMVPTYFADGTPVVLSACAPDDDVHRLYQWQFGDGTPMFPLLSATSDAVVVEHTWEQPDVYAVQLRVVEEDDNGASSHTLRTLMAVGDADAADCEHVLVPSVVRVDVPLPVQLCAEEFPQANTASSVQWLFGDGSGAVPATSSVVTHTFFSGGIYEVKVTLAFDEDDGAEERPDDSDDSSSSFPSPPSSTQQYTAPVSVVECPETNSSLIVARPEEVAIGEVQTFTLCVPAADQQPNAEVLVRWTFDDASPVESGAPTAAAQVYNYAWQGTGQREVMATVVSNGNGSQQTVVLLVDVAATDMNDARDCMDTLRHCVCICVCVRTCMYVCCCCILQPSLSLSLSLSLANLLTCCMCVHAH
jgi:PKD repeat protein